MSSTHKSEGTLSLLVPIYNEEDHLIEVLRSLDDFDPVHCHKEIVIVNDFSSDQSGKIIDDYPFKSTKVIRYHQKKNGGKGSAVHKAIELATGDILGVQDSDFEYDINEVPKLIEPIVSGKADMVYGSRFKKNAPQVHRTFHYLINRVLTLLSNLCSGLYVTDMETCYKFFKADVLKNINLKSKRFGFEPEVTAKVARLKVRVQELPISYFPRNYIEGKKITWRDGVAALWHIFYYNFLASKKTFFKATLPEKYVPNGSNWL